ncbi:hypothetical protein JCM15457_915 [Liquorilactobacillus sucicola DSM 21376 = JCM 15457]|uniref:Uncharacterized protein n=1 Tax=Liquorilactobacillus sucicola DSM 21376 = JCM 15457 TaxID=1423806 RepID=A0A023CW12_9LACO|nr:hypothetical protein [Liquorilactobacillus sucicola]KRN06082.1 hypothetical protein FD15_GL001271 [Liquorilactobacillus sucicola DSM 21376 = JCM 15457]GAJ26009.1 hypothetical protein JCM15457_915 [Liquorilactobacillus sucicola DSM 21376 = JCM 15457]
MHNSLTENQSQAFDFLDKGIKYIKFFGHSLAVADYAYFQSVFDYLNIYDSDVTLVFYYGNFHEENSEEMITYEHQIQKLLSIYGEKSLTGAHGKNLMTKLMLENRLQIKHLKSNEF